MQPEELEFWIDMNLPPSMVEWLKEFNVKARSFKELGFEVTTDVEVFKLAMRHQNVIVITTKDIDFLEFSSAIKNPPRVLHINTGNISNKQLRQLILKSFNDILKIFTETDQLLIELTD